LSDRTRDQALPGSDESKDSSADPATPRSTALRSTIASVAWLLAVLAALVLAVGALCVALRMNADNGLIKAVLDTADKLDFGVVKTFKGQNAATKEALVNWGLAAIVWLAVGKILDKLIRP
jgi:hypothetical protein